MPTLEPNPAELEARRRKELPKQAVFGVFDEPAKAEAAERRLLKAGVPGEGIHFLTGKEGIAILDARGERKSSLGAAVQMLSDFTTYLENYEQCIREGKIVIAVEFIDDADRSTITSILIDSGATNLSYATDWTITAIVERTGRG